MHCEEFSPHDDDCGGTNSHPLTVLLRIKTFFWEVNGENEKRRTVLKTLQYRTVLRTTVYVRQYEEYNSYTSIFPKVTHLHGFNKFTNLALFVTNVPFPH